MRIIKIRLTESQKDDLKELQNQADDAREPGLIIGQVEKGYAYFAFLEHETAVNVCAAKAGLAKPSKLNRKRIEAQMGGMK